jgi:hypothetical protein
VSHFESCSRSRGDAQVNLAGQCVSIRPPTGRHSLHACFNACMPFHSSGSPSKIFSGRLRIHLPKVSIAARRRERDDADVCCD